MTSPQLVPVKAEHWWATITILYITRQANMEISLQTSILKTPPAFQTISQKFHPAALQMGQKGLLHQCFSEKCEDVFNVIKGKNDSPSQ